MKPCSPAARGLARACLKLFIAGCWTFFLYFVIDWISPGFYDASVWAPIYAGWGLIYPHSGDLQLTSLDAYDNGAVMFTWLPVLVAALATLLLRAIPRGTVPKAYRRVRQLVGRALAWQAPPRRFWAWWCGGMTVADALVVALILALNLWYFIYYIVDRYIPWIDAVVESGLALPHPRSRLLLERTAITFGIMLWPNIWLLFLPIPQSSYLQQLTGLGYSQMIRYHRWFGHATMVVLSLHGWLYYIYWAASDEFWVEFSDWGTISAINNLAGTIGYIFGLVLWATSISWARRRFFEVFYRCHLVCFVGFTLFSYMHYFWGWTYFLPGLLLYAVDLVLRAGQLSGTTLVTGARVDEQAGVATVQLQTSKAMSGCPVHELFMLVPAISRWQWHPITVAGTAAGAAGSTLTLHIKRYGRWSAELLAHLQRPEPLAVRVSAPEGPPLPRWDKYSVVVLVGGGIGVTPLLAMLRHALDQRAADPGSAERLPRRVRLLWASRNPREFCVADPAILAAARASDGWLTVDLFSTAGTADATSLPEEGLPKDASKVMETRGSPSLGKSDSASGSDSLTLGGADPGAAKVLASPLFHKFARVVQPQAVGPLHLAAVYVLVWLGAYLGTYLGGAFVGESYTYFDTAGISPYPNTLYWKIGAIWFFTQAVMAIGLPYLLAVLPMHLWRYWRATKGPLDAQEVLALTPAAAAAGHGAGSFLVDGQLVDGSGEAGLEIQAGRPSLKDAILATAEGADGTVGVFVGGPEPMTRQVQLDVAALNSCKGCVGGGTKSGKHPYYEFRALAHTL